MSKLLGVPSITGYTELYADILFPRANATGTQLGIFERNLKYVGNVWSDVHVAGDAEATDLPFASEGDLFPQTEVVIVFRALLLSGQFVSNTLNVLPAENVPGALDLTKLTDGTNAKWVSYASLEELIAATEAIKDVAEEKLAAVDLALINLNGLRAVVVTEDSVTLTSTVPAALTGSTYTSPGGISVPAVRVNVPLLGQVSVLRAEAVEQVLGLLGEQSVRADEDHERAQELIESTEQTVGVLNEVVRRSNALPLLAFALSDGSIELVETNPDAITITESVWIAPDGSSWPVAEIEVPA